MIQSIIPPVGQTHLHRIFILVSVVVLMLMAESLVSDQPLLQLVPSDCSGEQVLKSVSVQTHHSSGEEASSVAKQ